MLTTIIIQKQSNNGYCKQMDNNYILQNVTVIVLCQVGDIRGMASELLALYK